MTKTFDTKLAELEKEKSELDLIFLQSKKQEYEQRISELLANPIHEGEEETAIAKFNEVRKYHAETKIIDYKIQHSNEIEKEINKKIAAYQERKERVNNIPLYRDTEDGIAEILGGDPVYQYAKETDKEKIVKKMEERRLNMNEYETHLENMYKELLKTYEKKKKDTKQNTPKKTEILLPEGMSEQIKEELKDDKDITPKEIERFLKNELKNNGGEIKISHIKIKFKNNYNQAYEYIRRLIINYSGFKIIDNIEGKTSTVPSKSKHEKLISSISQEESEEHRNERLRKSNLLFKLNEIGKIEDLEKRIPKYLDLFEELNLNFADRETFEPFVCNVISKHANIGLEKEIKKTLNGLIQGNSRMEKTGLYKYNVYKFNRDSRRMLAYPNGEIFTICQHEEYEGIINTQPPIDKTK